MTDEFMTPPAAAKLLGVGHNKILHWVRTGELVAVNLGLAGVPQFHISQQSLQEFLDAKKVSSPAKTASQG